MRPDGARHDAADLLAAALWYASRGMRLFPLHGAVRRRDGGYVCTCGASRCESPAKHPLARLAPKGLTNATTDAATVRHWWECVPTANVGVCTGHVVVLDVDPRHGGDESLQALEQAHQGLPHTWRALTGGGGEHLYFASPADREIRNSAGRIGPGLDVRGAGGYVVAPPSIHICGRRYAWSVDHHPAQTQIAPAPDWLVAKIADLPARSPVTRRERQRLVEDGIAEGGRDAAITRLTGHLLRRRVDARIVHTLMQSWNATHARPPLSDRQVTKIVASIARRELRRLGASRDA